MTARPDVTDIPGVSTPHGPALNPSKRNVSTAIVMTDLFISATAALLIVLAMARPQVPTDLPVQADILGFCPPMKKEQGYLIVSAAEFDRQTATLPKTASQVVVDALDAFELAVSNLGFSQHLFYSIALVSGENRPLTPACVKHFSDVLVGKHNRSLSDKSVIPGSRAVFAVEPVAAMIKGVM